MINSSNVYVIHDETLLADITTPTSTSTDPFAQKVKARLDNTTLQLTQGDLDKFYFWDCYFLGMTCFTSQIDRAEIES